MEQLKQRVTAKAAKIKQYENRVKQFWRNSLFDSDQRHLFEELDGKVRGKDPAPGANERVTFWSSIWGETKGHNKDVDWLLQLKEQLGEVDNQASISITPQNIRVQLNKTSNWKAPGPDGVQGYWLKNFTSLTGRIAKQLDNYLQQNNAPRWMNMGKTTLIMKDTGQRPHSF